MIRFRSAVTAVSTFNHIQTRASEHPTATYLQELAADGNLEELRVSIDACGIALIKERDGSEATLLHHAARTNQVEVMKYLIDKGMDVNATDEDGNTALHLAALMCHTEGIDFLLSSGASASILNKMKDSSLHIAAREKSGKVLESHSKYPVDYYIKGLRNRSIFHIISEVDNIEGIKILHNTLSADQKRLSIKLCFKDDDGLTPIHLAAQNNSYKTLEFLMSNCNDIGYTYDHVFSFADEENNTPLHTAIDSGNYGVVRVFLKYGASPLVVKENMLPPLHLACSQGKLDIVKAMVEAAGEEILCNTDQYKRTPLHHSSFSIHGTAIISYIMEKSGSLNIDINQRDFRGRTPLHISISSGNLSGVKELLARGSDPFVKDNEGLNALHFAVFHSRKAIITSLLEVPSAHCLSTELNNKGYSPVHIGLKLGLSDIVNTLISSLQLHPSNIKDSHGNNYFHLAASSGDWKALAAFLELSNAHKLLNGTNDGGRTPLHSAARNGHVKVVEILLNSGAMVHRSHKGVSPLMLACKNGHIECVKHLFKAYPFQVDWQDRDGDTALHYAVHSGNPFLIQYMLGIKAQIMHNDSGDSFFDRIVSEGDKDCGLAVVNHKRWQECLDLVSTLHGHPMLGLIRKMPEVAKAVLDRCHEIEHSSEESHPDYSITFNFKYLYALNEEEELSLPNPKGDLLQTKKPSPGLVRVKSRRNAKDDLGLLNIDTDLDDLGVHHHRRSVKNLPAGIAVQANRKKSSETMEVLMRMIQHKRVDLLIHPVVSAYLKKKWTSYGLILYSIHFSVLCLLVLSLLLFIAFSPTGCLEHLLGGTNRCINISENHTTSSNSTNSRTTSTSGHVARWFAVFFNSIFVINSTISMINRGLKSINFVEQIQVWNSIVAAIFNYAFLLAPNPFSVQFQPVGAVACFSTWLVLFGALEFFDAFGIYVNMFFKILRTVFKVLFLSLFLLMAFALSLNIMAGQLTEFSSIGYALFSVFGYMLGEIEYSMFIKKASGEKNELPNSRVVIALIVLLAIMMSIVMVNLLIGLAVGDIEQIKLNALYQRRAMEVDYFARVDKRLPKYFRRMIIKQSYRVYPNAHKSCRKTSSLLFKDLKSEICEISEKEGTSADRNVPIDMAAELYQVKLKLQEMADTMHHLQAEERHSRKKFSWQKAQSLLSVDSTGCSDFMPENV